MTRKWLINGLLALTIFVAVALIVAMIVAGNDGALTLQMGDVDYSDSPLAWVVAFPIVVIVCVIAALVTIVAFGASLVITILAVAMAIILAVFALILGLSPIVAFFAVPALAVYGLVKLVQPKRMAA